MEEKTLISIAIQNIFKFLMAIALAALVVDEFTRFERDSIDVRSNNALIGK